MSQQFTREKVLESSSKHSLLCIIDAKVYDLTDFVDAHPGGAFVLQQVSGKDATVDFYNLHRQSVLQQYSDLCVGSIQNEESQVIKKYPGDLSVVCQV